MEISFFEVDPGFALIVELDGQTVFNGSNPFGGSFLAPVPSGGTRHISVGATYSGPPGPPYFYMSWVLQIQNFNPNLFLTWDNSFAPGIPPTAHLTGLNSSYSTDPRDPDPIGAYVFEFTLHNTLGSTPTPTPTPSPRPTPALVLHRIGSPAAVANLNGAIDEKLVPVTDPTTLEIQPVIQSGLVADGVTPLLIELRPPSPITANYNITIDVVAGGTLQGSWPSPEAAIRSKLSTQSVSLSGAQSAFAYISGITSDELLFSQGSTELSVILGARIADGSQPEIVTTFKIRKPPIVLVHGYNTDGVWGSLSAFSDARPGDFVKTIVYASKAENTSRRLDTLALALDRTLTDTAIATGGIEDHDIGPFADWAFTRYDIVCHSQGGVLTRMLCTDVSPRFQGPGNAPFAQEHFRSISNFYRGRFHRIITIGSPQNGSVLPYYLSRLYLSFGYSYLPLALAVGGVLQNKFDPFGSQIAEINADGNLTDQEAKFHLIRGLVGSGTPTTGALPPVYSLTGLNAFLPSIGNTRGSVVLPNGSDGVVDWESETALVAASSLSTEFNTAHSGPILLLAGSLDAQTETGSANIANHVITLLDGPNSNFGTFIVPPPLTAGRKAQIDAVIPVFLPLDIIRTVVAANPSDAQPVTTSQSTTQYVFVATPDDAEPLQGQVNWYAQVFGRNGTVEDGVIVEPDPLDPTKVVVTVDNSVVGDVVLYASYAATDGKMVIARPKIVVSNHAGAILSGIALDPNSVNLSVGDQRAFNVWGNYNNGQQEQLYVPPNASIQFMSSNDSIVSVIDGIVNAGSVGSATVTCSYQGFSAQASIAVLSGPTPIPTPTATPSPIPGSLGISGTVAYCSNSVPGPVPNVRLSLTGNSMGSTLSDGSGSYQLSSLAAGGSYTITPTKDGLTPRSSGIDTLDAMAALRHYLGVELIPVGCQRDAADVDGTGVITTVDAIAIQRFFIGRTFGIANVGQYHFTPASRSYPGLSNNQTDQNYIAFVFGDIASGFVHRLSGSSQDASREVAATVASIALPQIDSSKGIVTAAVTTSAIDSRNKLVGFQGDFTFDERTVTFEGEPVKRAGLTAGNWNVSGNVLDGPGPIRTLRVSAFSNDFTPLSGTGTLFDLRMSRLSKVSTQLIWATGEDQFIFIDADLKTQKPGSAESGSVTASGKLK